MSDSKRPKLQKIAGEVSSLSDKLENDDLEHAAMRLMYLIGVMHSGHNAIPPQDGYAVWSTKWADLISKQQGQQGRMLSPERVRGAVSRGADEVDDSESQRSLRLKKSRKAVNRRIGPRRTLMRTQSRRKKKPLRKITRRTPTLTTRTSLRRTNRLNDQLQWNTMNRRRARKTPRITSFGQKRKHDRSRQRKNRIGVLQISRAQAKVVHMGVLSIPQTRKIRWNQRPGLIKRWRRRKYDVQKLKRR